MMMTTRRTRELAHKVLAQRERKRVADLLERDRIYNQRQREREAAEIQVAEGFTVRIGDAVDEPTPEWLAKGDFRTFTPRLEDGTVVTVKAYRRVRTPTIVRLYLDGKIAERIYHACMIYRRVFDEAGLTGRYKTSYISLTGNVGGGSGGMAQHPMARHHHEAEARDLYRKARAEIAERYVELFELVVIDDLSLRSASIRAKRDNSKLLAVFREAGERLADFFDAAGMTVAEDEIDAD